MQSTAVLAAATHIAIIIQPLVLLFTLLSTLYRPWIVSNADSHRCGCCGWSGCHPDHDACLHYVYLCDLQITQLKTP